MEALNELVLNTNTLLGNILLCVFPIVLVVFTLFIYSGLIDKLNKNMLRIVSAIIDFLEKLESKKVKVSMLVLTIIYVGLAITYLIIRPN